MQKSIARATLIFAIFATSFTDARADTAHFALCVAKLQDLAREDGISSAVVQNTLGRVSYVERVIELDRSQPEFTRTFADYYNRRVTPERIAEGRRLLNEHRGLLDQVLVDTGVPPHYLVAFWGLETNFGSYLGKMSVLDSLATLACDQRRSAFFTAELMAALHIIDAGDISAERMKGSWAGAIGHVQFMPSVFLRFAVDADHDGRRDLWSSIPDAMASGGNFLKALGWMPGMRWGREVLLPEGFDYARTTPGTSHSLRQWTDWGVTNAFGDPLPRLEVQASLLVPAGHRGPAFLTYRNFNVIMGWNRSEYYAIAVGRLADRIAGAGALARPAPEDEPPLPVAEVVRMQTQLNALGFEAGEPDGIIGPGTRDALRRFQHANGMIADGHANQTTVEALGRAESFQP